MNGPGGFVVAYNAKRSAISADDVAVADGVIISFAAMASGSRNCTSAVSVFNADHVGKSMSVAGAGPAGAALVTRITAVISPTVAQLAVAASTTVAAAKAVFGTDNQAAITASSATALALGLPLVFGPGIYCHSGLLTFTSLSVSGCGTTTILAALDPSNACCIFTGTSPRFKDMTVTAPATSARDSSYNAIGVLFRDATDFVHEGIHVDLVGNAGSLFDNCQDGWVEFPKATNTKADSLHFTNGCKRIGVAEPYAADCGDDSVAIVSYVSSGTLCEDITVHGGRSYRSATRGYTCVGGRRIKFITPYVEASQAAGIYIASESSFGTYGNEDCWAIDPTLHNCVQQAGISQGAVLINGRAGTATADGVTVSLDSHGCGVVDPVVRGAGPGMRAAVCFDPGSINPILRGGTFFDLQAGVGINTNVLDIGGAGAQIDTPYAENVSGVFLNLNTTAAGVVIERNSRMKSIATGTPVANKAYLLQNATGLTQFRSQGSELYKGTNTTIGQVQVGVAAGQYAFREFWIDGTLQVNQP